MRLIKVGKKAESTWDKQSKRTPKGLMGKLRELQNETGRIEKGLESREKGLSGPPKRSGGEVGWGDLRGEMERS